MYKKNAKILLYTVFGFTLPQRNTLVKPVVLCHQRLLCSKSSTATGGCKHKGNSTGALFGQRPERLNDCRHRQTDKAALARRLNWLLAGCRPTEEPSLH